MQDYKNLIIPQRMPLIDVMRQLDRTAKKNLFVINSSKKFLGSITDGDIRRWILKGGDLSSCAEDVVYRDAYAVSLPYSMEAVREKMKVEKISFVPVLDDKNEIIEMLSLERLFQGQLLIEPFRELRIPVVIMAGGEGTRLDPFTRILPKPLIPIGDKSILEVIIEKFLPFNVPCYYLAVNYKAAIIKAYLRELSPSYKISFLEENKPLGTIGALSLLKNKHDSPIIVTNCDILINTDYAELEKFHRVQGNSITVVVSIKNYDIPYGVCKIGNDGSLKEILEKPRFSNLINTGMYIISQSALKMIPDGEFFHATHLIDKVKSNGGKVGVFPISDDAWTDTGEWPEYRNAIKKISG